MVRFNLFKWMFSYTPPILGQDNKVLQKRIAELKAVLLNGKKEWISIRGYNIKNPVLLFLEGGPGQSRLVSLRKNLSQLEQYFVVVNWEQPGTGKSYNSISQNNLVIDTYIQDGIALIKYLCEEFNNEKVFIAGESWGSVLGIFLVSKIPEKIKVFIGIGQIIDFIKSELWKYGKALDIANTRNDYKKIKKLELIGKPPYYGSDVIWKGANYTKYLLEFMNKDPYIYNKKGSKLQDIFSAEFNLCDKINYIKGNFITFSNVYPQLYDINLRNGYTNLRVPIYFFIGRHDITIPISLLESYFEELKAPSKKIIWFENSGQSPWINENQRFIDEIINIKSKVIERS